jgi:hypothetical protein
MLYFNRSPTAPFPELSVYLIRPTFEFDDDGSTTALGAAFTGVDAGGIHFVPNFFYSRDISEK